MMEVEEAVALLQAAAVPIRDTVVVDILDARGCVAAGDILSPIAVPRFAKSAMDGYALCAADTAGASRQSPVHLRVLGEVYAGDDAHFDAKPGTAVRIMTGGAMPAGYDSVLMQEDSDGGEDTVAVFRALAPGDNVCPVGEDLQQGVLAIARHTRLSSHHIGILASMGYAQTRVLRPFRVGIIATGSELRHPGAPLGPAQIYNNSSYTIASHLKAGGVEVVCMDICPDNAVRFCQMARARLDGVDLLITTGGVSVGKKDFLPAAVVQLGATPLFHRVNMKPGTPVLAAQLDGKILLCLSGNPFAALVNFQVFFWPVLAAALQNGDFTWRRRTALLCEGDMKASRLRRFVRAFKNRDGVHLYTKNHRSSVVSNLPQSNCIVDQPPGRELRCGDEVEILYWKH